MITTLYSLKPVNYKKKTTPWSKRIQLCRRYSMSRAKHCSNSPMITSIRCEWKRWLMNWEFRKIVILNWRISMRFLTGIQDSNKNIWWSCRRPLESWRRNCKREMVHWMTTMVARMPANLITWWKLMNELRSWRERLLFSPDQRTKMLKLWECKRKSLIKTC